MSPLVSILIPTYNAESFLTQCLESSVNQTYQNLQVVIVDDGSSDNTYRLATEYTHQYNYIEVYYQKNAGVASARNKLLSLAKGDYVLFVDSDDWIEPNMVECLLKAVESSGADIAVCGNYRNESATETACPITDKQFQIDGNKEVVKSLLQHSILTGSLWNKLVPRKFYEGLTFREDIWYGEDCLFLWQALNRGVQKVCFIPDCLYHYRMNDQSISHESFNYKKMSGHKVWKQITAEAEQKHPDLAYIAKATYVQQDIMLLYYAAKSDYKCDDQLNDIRENVKTNIGYMKQAGISNPKRLLLGYALAYAYPSASKLVKALL